MHVSLFEIGPYDLYDKAKRNHTNQVPEEATRIWMTRKLPLGRLEETAAEFAQEYLCEPVAAGALLVVIQAVKEPPTDYEESTSVLIGVDKHCKRQDDRNGSH